MNILIINQYAGNRILGMVYRHYYLAKEWVKSGNKVMIIGGSFSHLRSQQPIANTEIIDGIEFRWIPVSTYKGSGFGRVKAMFDFVSKLWFNYKKYLGNFTPDVVISSSTYNFEIFPAKRIAQHYGAKLIYEVRDIWPLTPMELGGYSKHHPFIVVMQAAEDYCYRHANKVVSLLPNALEHMKERGMAENKFIYIPNGFDPEEWKDIPQVPPKVARVIGGLKKDGKFVIMYTGGHAISNALDFFLDAMKSLQDSNIVAVLIGKGQEKLRLIERVKNENIDNVIFLDSVSKKEIPAVLSLADSLYIGWKKNPLYKYGISPNKLFDYMMSGKPIIHSVAAPNDWVKDGKCGISVEAENADLLTKAIKEIAQLSPDTLDKMGKNGRQFCQSKFNYSFLADKFIQAIGK
ncbi:MAG: glycosyltransferase family 4 protein [Bacteroides sp.]|nr:glycosyltransferase family 4 protein [Bacteroides sp.]